MGAVRPVPAEAKAAAKTWDLGGNEAFPASQGVWPLRTGAGAGAEISSLGFLVAALLLWTWHRLQKKKELAAGVRQKMCPRLIQRR